MISPIPPIAPILGGVTTPKTDSNGQIEAASEVGLEKTCRLCRRNRQGASAVEFALVAPVFVVMVFGLIEFGRAIMVQQVMTNAAREGARLAILDSPTPVATTVKNTVVSYLHGCGIPAATTSNVTLSPAEPSTAQNGDTVTVTIQLPYSSVSWLPSPMFLTSKTLQVTCVMRRESIQ